MANDRVITGESTATPSKFPLVGVLFAAFIVLTLSGTGFPVLISLMGIILCVIGFTRRSCNLDWWIMAPLLVYVAMNLVSSMVTYGTVMLGYGLPQLIYPVLYATACCLSDGQTRKLRSLCVLWAGLLAVIGVIGFCASAFQVSATRFESIIGSPNGLGIFMVLGWFALQSCRMEEGEPTRLQRLLPYLEPVILVALALTLSMGSLAALFVGLVVMVWGRARRTSWVQAGRWGAVIAGKAVLAIGLGLLMYMAAERAEAPALAAIGAAYLAVLAVLWPRMEGFLKRRPIVAVVLTALGVLCVALAVIMRPSALHTFVERLAMMANGLTYLDDSPLTGVGPLQWRELNLEDSDIYFNTNHIHNMYIHAGVEFGLLAMAALIVITIRCFVKRYRQAQHGEDAAFLFHMLTDTGFFFVGVVSMFMLTANGSETESKALSPLASKVLFAVMGLAYVALLLNYLLFI